MRTYKHDAVFCHFRHVFYVVSAFTVDVLLKGTQSPLASKTYDKEGYFL